jgi:hypothetical protein
MTQKWDWKQKKWEIRETEWAVEENGLEIQVRMPSHCQKPDLARLQASDATVHSIHLAWQVRWLR